jgi:hypothetical protein
LHLRSCLRNLLKGTLVQDFLLPFFPSKVPTWSPDSYPKLIWKIKSNLMRYSNYSSLCVDSVIAGLNFASSYIKTFRIFWLILAPFEHFMVNFSKSYPYKGVRASYVCLFWLHLPHTESTRSETHHQLTQHWVRLHINWFNAEWDSTSTESMPKAPRIRKISSFRVDSVDMESHSMLTQLMSSLTWHWLSWRIVRICVNWVTVKC